LLFSALSVVLGFKPCAIAQRDERGLPPLTNAVQIRKLSRVEAAAGHRVRLEGVVTYIDPINPVASFIVIQDTTGGISALPRVYQMTPEIGERMLVEGVTAPGISQAIVSDAILQPLGFSALPDPARRSFAELLSGEEEGNWVEIHGTVRSTGEVVGRLEVEIICEGQRAFLLIRTFRADDPRLARLVDATVRVRGICVLTRDPAKRLTRHVLLVSGLADVEVLEDGPADSFGTLFRPSRALPR
jgi:hypothetical protein